MKKCVTAISVAAAAMGTSVVLCPPAAADLACPDMSNGQAGVNSRMEWQHDPSNPYTQRYVNGDPSAETDMANFLLSCSKQPAAAQNYQPPPPVDNSNAPDPDLAAIRATGDPTVGQAPNCTAYGQKYDGTPAWVDNFGSAADVASHLPNAPDLPMPNGSDVLLTCGAANSVIAGVDALTGNFPAAAQAAQQATFGDCWAGKHAIPFITIPGNC